MDEIKLHKTSKGFVLGSEMSVADIEPWVGTVAQVREAVLSWRVTGPGFLQGIPESDQFSPTQKEVESTADMTREAFLAGRVIDFGLWPNEVIKEGGRRGGTLYKQSAIGHPFRDPWVLIHSWPGIQDDPKWKTLDRPRLCVYLVNLLEQKQPAGGDFEIIELELMSIKGENTLTIGDRALLTPDHSNSDPTHDCYICPSVWRFIPQVAETLNLGQSPDAAAAGNVLDPIMTALLMLNTTGVGRETIHADAKLNKARLKSGKTPIPPYDVVDTRMYVTALQMRRSGHKGESQGGHHASPIPHLRRGFLRTYPSGVTSLIKDTLVRVSPEARAEFLRNQQRSHYAAKP